MSEKGMKMFDAVTEIRGDIIEQAADYKFVRSPIRFVKPAGIAACICLAGGAAVLALTLPGTKDIRTAGEIGTQPAALTENALYHTEEAAPEILPAAQPEGTETAVSATEPLWAWSGLPSAETFGTTVDPNAVTVAPGGECDLPAVDTADTTAVSVGNPGAGTTNEDDIPGAGDSPDVVIYDGGEDGNDFSIPDWDENPGGGGYFLIRGYTPPVFPLTSPDDTTGITVGREVIFDLGETALPGDLKEWNGNIDEVGAYTLYDSYTLKNTTDGDKTVKLMYPFKCSMNDLLSDPNDWDSATINEAVASNIPEAEVNGIKAGTTLVAGDYCGGWSSAGYPEGNDRSNLEDVWDSAWYYDLLKDGRYLKDALADAPELNEPVVVYRIYGCGTTYDTVTNDAFVTAEGSFLLDNDASAYVFGNDRSYGRQDRKITFGFMVNNRGANYDNDKYIVVRGGDIKDLKLQGYYTGKESSWSRTATDEIYYNVERYEAKLGDILPELIMENVLHDEDLRHLKYAYEQGAVTKETICDAAIKYMVKYGSLSEHPTQRYEEFGGFFEEYLDGAAVERIIYVTFDVTIRAGESVCVGISQKRYADMKQLGEEGRFDYGLELFTDVGSTLDFRDLTVRAEGIGGMKITSQNLGLDAENRHISQPDMSESMYYVRFIPE